MHGLGFRLRELSRAAGARREDLLAVAETALPDVCQNLRNVCSVLLLPDFKEGLTVELDAYADVVQGMHPGLTIARDFEAINDDLNPEQQAVLYRISRTLLDNIGKHAEATDAEIHLTRTKGGLRLRIEDNGRGFDVPEDWDAHKHQKHYGMYMADYFTRSMGGVMTVTSCVGTGTIVTITVPMSRTGRDGPIDA